MLAHRNRAANTAGREVEAAVAWIALRSSPTKLFAFDGIVETARRSTDQVVSLQRPFAE